MAVSGIHDAHAIIALAKDEAIRRGLAQRTLLVYQRIWLAFVVRVARRELALETLRSQDALAIYEELVGDGKVSRQMQVRAALRFIFSMIGREDPLKDLPELPVQPPKERVKLCDQEAARLIMALSQIGGGYAQRLNGIIGLTIALTGEKYSDVASLHRSAWQNGTLTVAGTTHPLVPLHEEALVKWREFFEGVRAVRLRRGGIQFAASELLFPGRAGTPYSYCSFSVALKKISGDLGILGLTSHDLRWVLKK